MQVDMSCRPGMSVCRQNMKPSKADVRHVCEQASTKEAGTHLSVFVPCCVQTNPRCMKLPLISIPLCVSTVIASDNRRGWPTRPLLEQPCMCARSGVCGASQVIWGENPPQSDIPSYLTWPRELIWQNNSSTPHNLQLLEQVHQRRQQGGDNGDGRLRRRTQWEKRNLKISESEQKIKKSFLHVDKQWVRRRCLSLLWGVWSLCQEPQFPHDDRPFKADWGLRWGSGDGGSQLDESDSSVMKEGC